MRASRSERLTSADRDERAHRILDAAAQLVLRYGYDKTSIDDIARAADVAKGTIYLHWTTRDAIFVALLGRERVAMLEAIRARIDDEPEGMPLRAFVRLIAIELAQRPLVRAALFEDLRILGRFVRQKRDGDNAAAARAAFEAYLEMLQKHRLLRTDLSLAEQAHVVAAGIYGFFMMAPLMPPSYRLDDERLADLLSDTVHRTLEPGTPISASKAKAVRKASIAYLDRAIELARERLARALERPSPKGAR